MTVVRVDGLQELLKGLASGTFEIVLRANTGTPVPVKRGVGRPRKSESLLTGKTVKPMRKAPRKAMPPKPADKKMAKEEKVVLPEPRQIFLFLRNKRDGVKLTPMARNFGIKRSLFRPLLDKLVAAKDIDLYNGAYFLRRRLRKVDGPAPEKPTPISSQAILATLGEMPGATLTELAHALGETSYQRLIKPMNALKTKGLVVLEGKSYRLY